jgi:hypothetical protein
VWREPRSFSAVPKSIFYGEQFVYSDVTAKRALVIVIVTATGFTTRQRVRPSVHRW